MMSATHSRKRKPTTDDDDAIIGLASSSSSSSLKPATKKRVRIGGAEFQDAPAYPPAGFGGDDEEDDQEEDLETKKGRRGAVNLDGYDSESDSDSDSGAPAAGGEDDDMFGSTFETPQQKKKKKNEPTFLKRDHIEGQEWGDDTNGDMDEDEGDGADGAEVGAKVKITPFNMDEELEEGDFDESGHYIRKKDELQMHDNWLQGVTKDQIEKAKAAQEKQLAQSTTTSDDAELDTITDPNHLWLKAIHLMKPGENIPKALRRLAGPKTAKARWKKNAKKGGEGTGNGDGVDPKAAENAKSVAQLTSYVDKLMGLGVLDAYDLQYEAVVRQLRAADLLYEDWQPPVE
ncbi:uncharacterized protein EV422DRAFT_280863 [Fimicolochytrium jonesii]|uniref:uncharacterized protein n=1 Tax=Fimicolochytrium jonesii TaxID=1396493 RepID=UPI0022FE7068|nr:uncharacterized protein EV422DRAFT_280863 [Fimicolochytrium jonesii]KAI8816616.1 hypothetical protein EV422DRAFT_280863 [Fimicolochytrium jonesii]